MVEEQSAGEVECRGRGWRVQALKGVFGLCDEVVGCFVVAAGERRLGGGGQQVGGPGPGGGTACRVQGGEDDGPGVLLLAAGDVDPGDAHRRPPCVGWIGYRFREVGTVAQVVQCGGPLPTGRCQASPDQTGLDADHSGVRGLSEQGGQVRLQALPAACLPVQPQQWAGTVVLVEGVDVRAWGEVEALVKQSCGAFVVPDQEVMDTDIEQGADAMAQNSEVGVVAGQSVGDFPDRGVVGTAHQGEAGGVDGGPRCAVGAVTDGVLGPVHPLLHHLRGPVRVDREGDHGAGGEFRAGGKFFDGLFYFAFADGVAGLVAQEESEGEADLAARGGGELRVVQDVAQGGGGGGGRRR
ncbi:hypothetical protein L1085_035600 [Streptomyces sp. MSC1_001]|uniref:hypothetical protein n=1 Tax=Streptomyces sp. MSC1_001 TaxID=2909263 RepID=UPI00202ED853|nr:hypothetical protein [Streptomyces sp. MSC1_001]